jgi:hypothetical protein
MDIERTWWFRGGVMLLTIVSAEALFFFAGMWPASPHSFSRWVAFFFCVAGLQRTYAGLFGMAAIIAAPQSDAEDPGR